jgi:hypothetical protein
MGLGISLEILTVEMVEMVAVDEAPLNALRTHL